MVIANEKASVGYNQISSLKRRRSAHINIDDKDIYESITLNDDIFKQQPAIAAALLSAWEQEEMKLKNQNAGIKSEYVTLYAPNKILRTSTAITTRSKTPKKPELSKQGSPALNKSSFRSVKTTTTSEKSRLFESPIFRRIRKVNHTKERSQSPSTERDVEVDDSILEDRLKCDFSERTELQTPSKRHSISTWIKRRSSFGINPKSRTKDNTKKRTSLSASLKTEDQFLNCSAFKKDQASGNTQAILEDVINHKVGRKLFHDFLKKEFSDENLEFWIECENFKTMSPSKQAKQAQKIYQKFVEENSPMEVNLDSPTKMFLASDVLCPSGTMFDEAQRQIYKLMQQDSFPRFVSHIRTACEKTQ